EIRDESHFEQFIHSAYQTALPQNAPAVELNLGTHLDIPSMEIHHPEVKPLNSSPESSLIRALEQSLDRGEIHLKYQQLYDKQDTNLYTYEVTSGFIFENSWKDLSSLRELAEDPELSIKLDRWRSEERRVGKECRC